MTPNKIENQRVYIHQTTNITGENACTLHHLRRYLALALDKIESFQAVCLPKVDAAIQEYEGAYQKFEKDIKRLNDEIKTLEDRMGKYE